MGHVNVGYRRGVEGIADTDESLSGFWGDCPILSAAEDAKECFGHIEDGLGVVNIAADGATGQYDVELTAAAGTPAFGSYARSGGALQILTGTTDEDETCVQWGGETNTPFRISDAVSEARKLWFEILAIAGVAITASSDAWFLGLCESFTMADNALIEADGTIHDDRDLIGFFHPEGDAGLVDFVYQKGGGGVEHVTLIDGALTMSTSAFKKMGFMYNPDAPDANKVRIYYGGVEQSTYVTAALIAASTFPDAVLMTSTFCVKVATEGTAQSLIIPTWGCYQEK